MKILVIGPSWVGDMMMSHSLYRALKQRHKEVVIEVMAPAWCKPLLARMPEVNTALDMPLGHGALALAERYKLGCGLRQRQYQQAIVLPNSLKSALVPLFARVPRRTGWRGEMRYGLLNDMRVLHKVDWPLMVERYVALAYDRHTLRCASDLAGWQRPCLQVTAQEIQQVRQAFALTTALPLVAFCPGAEFGPAKRWPHYHYASLAGQLITEGYQILMLGSAKDHDTGQQILQQLDAEQRQLCHNLTGKTSLDQAVMLLAMCQAVVSNDSGLMHIAAALNRPLVALYGPSSPQFTPPLADRVRIIRLISGYQKIRRGDGEQGYHQSLVDITPQQVFEQLKEVQIAPAITDQHNLARQERR